MIGSKACLICRRECNQTLKYRVCSSCAEKLERNEHICSVCGAQVPEGYDKCDYCRDKEYFFDYARSIFVYENLARELIIKFKFGGYKTYAMPLGKMLADYYEAKKMSAQVVTFVPMPRNRQRARGYNQAEHLADEFCLNLGMEPTETLLRENDDLKQSTLDADLRAQNMKGKFKLISRKLVKGKDVLLIDDIMTTGATASECARVLKEGGARSVVVLTVAKTRIAVQ